MVLVTDEDNNGTYVGRWAIRQSLVPCMLRTVAI